MRIVSLGMAVGVSMAASLACGSTPEGDTAVEAPNGREDAGQGSRDAGDEPGPGDAGDDAGRDATVDAMAPDAADDAGGSDAGGTDGGTGTPTAPRSILVSVGLELQLYGLTGELLRSVPVPAAHRQAGEGLRGVVEDAAGRVHVFAGTFAPRLATWDGADWTSRTIGGTPNVVHYGHLAAVGDVVLATGMNIKFSRYDTITQVVDYIPTDVVGGATYTDVSTGGDGKLYAVDSNDVTVELDPVTLAVARTLPISPSPDLIAADANGLLHGAWTQNGQLCSFPEGGPATCGASLGIGDFQDIDLAADGTFIVCGNGKLVIGRLGDPQVITKTLPFQTAFCSFGYVPR